MLGVHLFWGSSVVSNGLRLRLLRDNASLTRQAFVEWDLESLFDGQVYPDFVVLWKTLHQSRFEGERPADCWLERWAGEASARGIRALEDLRQGVQKALEALGRGFVTHPENGDLRAALANGRVDGQALYRQLLRVVYRLIFLAVAEDRDLLHPPNTTLEARSRYERYYSLRRLRHLAERRTGTPHGDLWQSLLVVRRALDDPAGLSSLGLAGLGSMLWSGNACPDLEKAALANRELLAAVRALSLVEDNQARQLRPVDYRNLGPEELGSVYESLLELDPRVAPNATNPADAFTLRTAAGHERKTTGSYYTPTSLIARLLDSALDPVLDEAVAKADPEAALLGLTVVDPACGSGHFLIAAAHRIAQRLASVRTGEPDAAPEAVRTALRDVIGSCVHGVDVNRMAVELCKVGLWMEALDPGKPLSFLEHRIVVGNALLGATPELLDGGIPDEAFVVLSGDDKEVVSSLKKRNKTERKGGQSQLFSGWDAGSDTAALALQVAAIDSLPDESVEAVRAKEVQWALLDGGERRLARLRADAWCAAFVLPKRPWTIQFTDGVWHALVADPASASRPALDAIEQARAKFSFLHWHIDFADVMAKGGFDVVLSNPPWDQVQFDDREFFAVRAPEIADAPTMARRKQMLNQLSTADPTLYELYTQAANELDAIKHFVHTSRRYPLTSYGRLNYYSLFMELDRSLLSPTGRLGVVVPTGIATDAFNQYFISDVLDANLVASMYDFENKGLFPDVDSRYKFCLLTLVGIERPVVEGADLAFFCHDVSELDDPDRRFRLSPKEIDLLNPNTHTVPIFRSRRDAEITLGIYRRVPVLIREKDPEGNPWKIHWQLMFMTNTDSGLFRTREELEAEGFELSNNVFHRSSTTYLPLYEGKMVQSFDHRAADVVISASAGVRQRQPRYFTAQDHQDPERWAIPHSWVDQAEVTSRLADYTRQWLLGFCQITSATNERTVIAAVIPRSAAADTLPLLLSTATVHDVALLGASLASFPLDFAARQKVGGVHLNFFIVQQFPVLPPATYDRTAPWASSMTLAGWLLPRVLELSYNAWDLAGFAGDLGYDGPPLRWDDERRAVLRAELDACFFHLYGLERDDVEYVMGTFPIVERHDRERFGEYRTKRLILEVYDALGKASESGEMYISGLSPAPDDLTLIPSRQ